MTYPLYIQKRIDTNNERIKELKQLILTDDDSVELFKEIVFLKEENAALKSTNYEVQIDVNIPVEEMVEISDEGSTLKIEEEIAIIENINLGSTIAATYVEKEEQVKAEYGEVIYQKNTNDTSYIEEDDMTLFKKYNIQFMNGLAVNINIDSTPRFVIERIRRLDMAKRLALSVNSSDEWGNDKIRKIYFEHELIPELFKDITSHDKNVEDSLAVKEFEKEYVLVQMKPDLVISTSYRYTFVAKFENFDNFYDKMKDLTKEFKFPVYKQKPTFNE